MHIVNNFGTIRELWAVLRSKIGGVQPTKATKPITVILAQKGIVGGFAKQNRRCSADEGHKTH